MSLKLIFNQEGKILGAQGIGYDGVDKIIDVIARVIRYNGTVDDLTELELCYAPPYSSDKDPVNMAGFVAQNVLVGRAHMVAWNDIYQLNDKDYILLDVRTKVEFENRHIDGAINLLVDSLIHNLNKLDKNKAIIYFNPYFQPLIICNLIK